MGYRVSGHCASCNFETSFLFGSGRYRINLSKRPDEKQLIAPGINCKTKKFELGNYYLPEDRENLVFYNNAALRSNEPTSFDIGFGDVTLCRKGNKCPECEAYTFNFYVDGLFD